MPIKRRPIRDNKSPGSPRLFDFIQNDNGEYEFELKNGKIRNTITLRDLSKQVYQAINDFNQ